MTPCGRQRALLLVSNLQRPPPRRATRILSTLPCRRARRAAGPRLLANVFPPRAPRPRAQHIVLDLFIARRANTCSRSPEEEEAAAGRAAARRRPCALVPAARRRDSSEPCVSAARLPTRRALIPLRSSRPGTSAQHVTGTPAPVGVRRGAGCRGPQDDARRAAASVGNGESCRALDLIPPSKSCLLSQKFLSARKLPCGPRAVMARACEDGRGRCPPARPSVSDSVSFSKCRSLGAVGAQSLSQWRGELQWRDAGTACTVPSGSLCLPPSV